MAENCETCIYWERNSPFPNTPRRKDHQHCLRFPPILVEGTVGVFPMTGAMTWCGEHDPVPFSTAPAPEPVPDP
jgi:hypothetical protein